MEIGMTTTITTQFSRSIQIDDQWIRLQPGDQVDNSLELAAEWCTVARLGSHGEDEGNDDADDDRFCEGNCEGVIFFEEDDYAFAFHVRPGDEIHVRFPMVAE
jgi:hypothetical protein